MSESGAECKANRRARQEWLGKRLSTLDGGQRETLREAADLMLALVDEGPSATASMFRTSPIPTIRASTISAT